MELDSDLPSDPFEKGLYLQNMLISFATGRKGNGADYTALRKFYLSNETTKQLVPQFVRTCRDLSSFWAWIKTNTPTYQERRELIRQSLPLLDHLEGSNSAPVDAVASDVLTAFNADEVHAVWEKALARRQARAYSGHRTWKESCFAVSVVARRKQNYFYRPERR